MNMTLSTRTLIQIGNALAALDGKLRVARDGEREQVIREPYLFGKGLRFAIGKNIANIQPHIESYNKSRDDLITKVSGGLKSIDPENRDQMAEFEEANELFLSEVRAVTLVEITEDELRLESNPIPGTVLAGLAPIIKGMVEHSSEAAAKANGVGATAH